MLFYCLLRVWRQLQHQVYQSNDSPWLHKVLVHVGLPSTKDITKLQLVYPHTQSGNICATQGVSPTELKLTFGKSLCRSLIWPRTESLSRFRVSSSGTYSLLLEAVLYLRSESDRSNLPKYSAGARLGIHSESHGSESCLPLARQGTLVRAPALFSISAISPRRLYSISWFRSTTRLSGSTLPSSANCCLASSRILQHPLYWRRNTLCTRCCWSTWDHYQHRY